MRPYLAPILQLSGIISPLLGAYYGIHFIDVRWKQDEGIFGGTSSGDVRAVYGWCKFM